MPIATLQARLADVAQPKTKAWWERYLKGVIPFRSVKMAGIRAALHDWINAEGLADQPTDRQKDLAFALLQETYTEDKLAGILYLQERLLPAGMIDWTLDLPRFAALFDDGYVYDWNTCDWLCVKVLGPLAQRDGEPCARAIAAWKDADTLWRHRASGVAFVNLAKQGDAFFPGFMTMLLEGCAATVQSPERFVQTGTGWVLRELSLADLDRVVAFITDHLPRFSREGLRTAVEKLPAPLKDDLLERHRAS